jgi:hypothetical protein
MSETSEKERMVLLVFDTTGKELLKVSTWKYPPFEVARFREWAEAKGYREEFS